MGERENLKQLSELKRTLEMEEAQVCALNASIAEECDPEMFRLIEVLGLEKTLELMLALPGVSITIPRADTLPKSINLASAALAVSQNRMTVEDAAYHYYVSIARLKKVAAILKKYYRDRIKVARTTTTKSLSLDIKRMFSRFARGDLPDF